MEFRHLDVTVNSAKDLKYVRHVQKMKVYVVVSLSGNPGNENQQRTPVLSCGGTNLQWDHPFSFDVDEAAAHAGRLTLNFVIMDQHKMRSDEEVGRVGVPLTVLFKRGGGAGDGTSQVMSDSVRLPSGETQGVLEFSYKFRELFTVATPPEANNKPVIADPAAGGRPNAAPGNQRPSAVGFISGLVVTDVMANVFESVANVGNKVANACSFEAGGEDGVDEANM